MDTIKGLRLAITISPPDQVDSPKDLYSNWYIDLIKYLKPSTERFCLYPELQHPTGRLHYHGMLTLKDDIKFYRHTLPGIRRHIGYVKIKKIKNELPWLIYCMKEWAYTQQTLNIKEPVYRKRINKKTTIPKPERKPRVKTLFEYGIVTLS